MQRQSPLFFIWQLFFHGHPVTILVIFTPFLIFDYCLFYLSRDANRIPDWSTWSLSNNIMENRLWHASGPVQTTIPLHIQDRSEKETKFICCDLNLIFLKIQYYRLGSAKSKAQVSWCVSCMVWVLSWETQEYALAFSWAIHLCIVGHR